MSAVLGLLLRQGIRRGLLGGSRGWLAVGGAALAVRLVRKLGGSEPKVVYHEELKPGEALVIANGRDATMVG
ncbi:MAG: hypothetical protein M3394_10250 [Actinomycetota bacterium]|nr:hypothetical protein [Actinomycetota bacterium]